MAVIPRVAVVHVTGMKRERRKMKEARPVVNWKQVAEDDLRKYRDIEAAVTSNREKIVLLTAETESVKAMHTRWWQGNRG